MVRFNFNENQIPGVQYRRVKSIEIDWIGTTLKSIFIKWGNHKVGMYYMVR